MTTARTLFSDEAIDELTGPRSRFRRFQESLWALDNLEEVNRLALEAETPDTLSAVAAWGLHRAMWKIAETLTRADPDAVFPPEIRGQLKDLFEAIQRSDNYRFGITGGNNRLWFQKIMSLSKESDIPEAMTFFLYSYLATGHLPTWSVTRDPMNSQIREISEAILKSFQGNEQISAILVQRDKTKKAIENRADELAHTSSDSPSYAAAKLLLAGCPGYSENEVEPVLDGVRRLAIGEVLAYFKALIPVRPWGKEKKDLERDIRDFLTEFNMGRERLAMSILEGTAVLLARQARALSLGENIALLEAFQEKEREFLKNDLRIYRIALENLVQRIVSEADEDRDLLVLFLLEHPGFHDDNNVARFLYAQWARNPDSSLFAKALAGSWRLRHAIMEEYRKEIFSVNSGYSFRHIPYKKELLEGKVDTILKLFQPSDGELYSFLKEVQEMSIQSPFARRLEQWRGLVSVAYRRKGKWIPSKESLINSDGLRKFLGETNPFRKPSENELRKEAAMVLERAGFAEGADSLPISLIRCVLFFEAGGIEKPLEFRRRMEKLLREAGTTDEDLTVLARFLNSDYMYSLQEEHGMPSLFALENMEKVEVAKGIMKSIFVSEKPSPEEVIVNRGFYRVHTWGEYIAHFNTLVHLRVTGQSAEYDRLLHIDQDPERFRGFAGEFTESAIEKPDIVSAPYSGKLPPKEKDYTAGIKKVFSRLFERVFRRLISSSPKYVDRRDLSAALEDGSLFRYVLESSKTFDALLAEAKALLPRSVYRNYWLLHLLARKLHEEDPAFDLSRPVDLVRMKKHLEKRRRQGRDLVGFYQAIGEVVPLLVRDPRMETMNEGLLAFWALKRSGKKTGGVGDPIKEEREIGQTEQIDYKFDRLQILPLAEVASTAIPREDLSLWQKAIALVRGVARRAGRLVRVPFEFVGDLVGVARLFLRLSFYQVWFISGIAKNWCVRAAKSLVEFDEPSTDLNYLAVQVEKQLATDLFQAINKDRPAMRFLRWLLSSAESVRSRTGGVFAKVVSPIFDVVQVTRLFITLLYLRAWYSSGFARERYKKSTRKLVEQRSLWATIDEENIIDETFSVRSGGAQELRTLVENYFLESILHALQKENWALRMLREGLLAVNRRLHPSGDVDFFYFDFQAKQTQLDTGLGGLAEDKIKADMGSSIAYDEKIRALLAYFPRQSPARDEYLIILAEHEISQLSNQNPALLLEHLNKLRLLFANEYFDEKLALRAFVLERSLRPDLFVWDASLDSREDVATLHRAFIERNVSLAKSYFRPGYLRDDVLLAILEETWTYDDYALIKPLLYQYKGGVLKEEEAAKTNYFEDKMRLFLQDATAVDKKDFLLWVLGVKGKPLFLREWEYYFGVNLDRVRDVFRERGAVSTGGLNLEQVGVSAKKEMIRQMFAGEGGILETPAVFDDFMNDVFEHVVPRRGKVPREKLRTILRVILEKSDSNRRVEIVQSLAVNLAGALAGEELDQNQVISRFFESLGLVGVKMAQTLAHSYDIDLDQELRESLVALSSRADPLSKMVVFETIENMYPGGFAANFESVKNSLGSASIKIVYRARKKGAKEDIALKVKRPAVDQSLEADMAFLTAVLKALREEGFSIPLGMENRISGAIGKDADFEGEAEITRRFEEQFRDEQETYALQNGTPVDFEIAPITHVMRNVMETGLAAGFSLDREDEIISRGIATPQEFDEIKKIVFDMLMRQVFRHGYYLADPHGGNFHLTRENGRLKVIFIDSGSAEEVTLENRQNLLEAMIWLAVNPGRSIPQEYLYTSVFFAKLGYLREGVPHLEMLRGILKYLEVKDGDHVLSADEYMAKIQSRFASEMTARNKVAYLWRSWKRKKLSSRSAPKSLLSPQKSGREPLFRGDPGIRGFYGLRGALYGEKALFERGLNPLFAAVHGLAMESEGVLRAVSESLGNLGVSQVEWMNPSQWPEIIRKAAMGGFQMDLIRTISDVLIREGTLRKREWSLEETTAFERVQKRLSTENFPGVRGIEYVRLEFDSDGSVVDPLTGAAVKMDASVFMGFDMRPNGTLRVFVHPDLFKGVADPAAFLLDAMNHEILEGPGGVEHLQLENKGIGMDPNIDWATAEGRIPSVQLRLATNLLERWSQNGDPDALMKLAMVGGNRVNWDSARPSAPVGALRSAFALVGDRGQRVLAHLIVNAENAGMDPTHVERLINRGLLVAGWRLELAEGPGAFRYLDVSPLDEAPGSENRLVCETLLAAMAAVIANDINPTNRAHQIFIGYDNQNQKTFVESGFPSLKGTRFIVNHVEGTNLSIARAATDAQNNGGASSLHVHTLRELETKGMPQGFTVKRIPYSLNTIMQKVLDSLNRIFISA